MPSTAVHQSIPKTTPGERLLRMPAVEHMTGFRRSWIYKLIERGAFPRAVATGERARAWRLSDVERWVESRPVAHARAA